MIKAIETRFRGRLFRSRLEARWAVFFEALGLPWIYEGEGFRLSTRDYLPDFWLPRQKAWVEIKPGDFSESTAHLTELAIETDSRVYLLKGDIPRPSGFFPENETGGQFGVMHFPDGSEDEGYCFCRCQRCGEYGIEFEGRSGRINCCQGKDDGSENPLEETISAAYDAARTRRFEHGFDEWS